MKKNFQVDYVDVVTEPGPNKILADDLDKELVSSIKKRVDISVNCHGSNIVAVVGHYGCAGNPSDREIQIKHLKKAKT